MSAPSRALVIALAIMLAPETAIAGGGALLGGFICGIPFVPDCADQPSTYQKPEDLAACQRDLDRYAAMTAAYRDCLERQIAIAVRHANDVLDHFHCQSRHDCPADNAKPK
jgi:hypothetical protein